MLNDCGKKIKLNYNFTLYKEFDKLCEAHLYWIRTTDMNDISKDGYVGVSKQILKRLSAHANDLVKGVVSYSDEFVNAAFTKDIIVEIVDAGSFKDLLYKEQLLRPNFGIGWNIAVGGISPRTTETITILNETISDGRFCKAVGWAETTLNTKRANNKHYCVEILASKSVKFDESPNRDFCQVGGVDYYYSDLSPSIISDVLSSYNAGESVHSIGGRLNLHATRVKNILKLFWVDTTEKFYICYDGFWFNATSDEDKYNLYWALKFLDSGASYDDAVIVYGYNKYFYKKLFCQLKKYRKSIGVI